MAAPPGPRESLVHLDLRLRASPAALWPYVSDTDRVNQSIGLPPWEFVERRGEDRVEREGSQPWLGLTLAWDEKPFEWIYGRELGVERLYKNGPIARFKSHVRLDPDGTGTALRHTLSFEGRGAVWSLLARAELGVRVRRRLERVYKQIDDYLTGTATKAFTPPPPKLEKSARARLEEIRPRLTISDGFDPALVRRLLDFVLEGEDRAVARLRPFELAQLWGHDRRTVLRLCLSAVRRGLLELGWDVLCPLCRGAKVRVQDLARLAQEAHCPACDVRIDTSAERALELVFSPSPAIRRPEVRIHCIGGPGSTPHVLLQRRLAPGERVALSLDLTPGTYRVRSPSVAKPAHVVSVLRPGGEAARVAVSVAQGQLAPPEVQTPSGPATVELANEETRERVLLLERAAWHDDAVTPGAVATLQEFRELFPSQVPPASARISAGRLAVCALALARRDALAGLGDDEALLAVQSLCAGIRDVVRARGGSVALASADVAQALDHDVSVATFVDAAAAVDAAGALLNLARAFSTKRGLPDLGARCGVDAGLCVAVARDDRFESDGPAFDSAMAFARAAEPGQIVIDAALGDEAGVAVAAGKAGLSSSEGTLAVGAVTRRVRRLFARERSFSETPTIADGVALEDLELGDEIGSGGTATVREGLRKRDGQRFAVKIIRATRTQAVERFEREVRVLERLVRVPGIVAVRGHGRTAIGLWIAMDLIEGRPLAQAIHEQGHFPSRVAASVGARIARAIVHAHEQGVIHRDLKPSNVILDGNAEPWVIDFGIARVDGEAGLTSEGYVAGTLAYIAPESLSKGCKIDGRADLYSLGATLFEMVAGRPPFDAPNIPELIAQVANQPAQDLRTVRADVSDGIAAVIAHCLEKTPEARYRTAEALAQDLEQLVLGEPPLEAPPLPRITKRLAGLFRRG